MPLRVPAVCTRRSMPTFSISRSKPKPALIDADGPDDGGGIADDLVRRAGQHVAARGRHILHGRRTQCLSVSASQRADALVDEVGLDRRAARGIDDPAPRRGTLHGEGAGQRPGGCGQRQLGRNSEGMRWRRRDAPPAPPAHPGARCRDKLSETMLQVGKKIVRHSARWMAMGGEFKARGPHGVAPLLVEAPFRHESQRTPAPFGNTNAHDTIPMQGTVKPQSGIAHVLPRLWNWWYDLEHAPISLPQADRITHSLSRSGVYPSAPTRERRRS